MKVQNLEADQGILIVSDTQSSSRKGYSSFHERSREPFNNEWVDFQSHQDAD